MVNVIDQQEGERFVAYHGDCVDVVRGLPSESVGHCVYSPPFASLYTYSALDRDMGNCPGASTFSEHFAFLLPEIFRVLKPGRSMAMHCMELPASKTHDGFIGLQDFPGDLIRAAQGAGFHFHSRTTIWKDPVTAMQRTKALGLLWKQLKKDSAMTRTGIPDYLIVMRKPGQNPDPISHSPESFPVREWQRIASPIWDRDDIDQSSIFEWMAARESEDPGMLEAAELLWRDINPSDTLQFRSAREHQDERHICPLQLEVIRRSIRLWSNPNDVILTPFGGIGSEGVVAMEMGRRAILAELKPSYYKQLVRNMRIAERRGSQPLGELFAPPAEDAMTEDGACEIDQGESIDQEA